jgi:hypothetical protein
MVATAQALDRDTDRGGPRPAGGGWQGRAGQNQLRTLKQNKLLHDAITDISNQLPWPVDTGELHDVEWWKRRLTLQWLKETGETPDLIESLDGLQFALLLPHTSDLNTKQCAALLEWISIFGAQNGVTFGKLGAT